MVPVPCVTFRYKQFRLFTVQEEDVVGPNLDPLGSNFFCMLGSGSFIKLRSQILSNYFIQLKNTRFFKTKIIMFFICITYILRMIDSSRTKKDKVRRLICLYDSMPDLKFGRRGRAPVCSWPLLSSQPGTINSQMYM